MTACATYSPQQDTKQVILQTKCPPTPKPTHTDLAGLYKEYFDLLILYKECSEKHNAAVSK